MEFFIEKNDIVELTIEDISEAGEGIGRADGYTLFIKDALPGDRVRAKVTKAKESYGYARLQQILKPSPDRVEPVCPVAAPCGGCQLQALSYEGQLKFKERKVANALTRIGGFTDPPLEPVIGMEYPFEYRNKAQYPFARSRDGRIISGFYAGRTHSIIESPRCCLGDPVNEKVLHEITAWMEQYGIEPYNEESHTGLIRHVLIRTGERTDYAGDKGENILTSSQDVQTVPNDAEPARQVMVCVVINGLRLPRSGELTARLLQIPGMTSISYNINTERTNVILGSEIRSLYGNGFITDRIGDIRYQISPQSFYQVNREQTEKLYAAALEYAGLTGTETVWDLYCGIGTISLFLARQAKKVCGVEAVTAAVEDARANALMNGITNTDFYAGRAEEVLPEMYSKKGARADVIVVDPPRKGCSPAVLETISQMAPERVVYVSCNPSTLARDLKILCENSYELRQAQPVDMFPQTTGIETAALICRK